MLAKRVAVIARPRKQPHAADVHEVKVALHSLRLNASSSTVANGISSWRRTGGCQAKEPQCHTVRL